MEEPIGQTVGNFALAYTDRSDRDHQAVWIVGNVFVVGEIPSSQTQFVDSSTNRSKPDYALTVLEN